jgi:hypothetical protein
MNTQKLSSTITTAPKPKKRKLTERDKLYSVLVSFKKVQDNIAKQKEKSQKNQKKERKDSLMIIFIYK